MADLQNRHEKLERELKASKESYEQLRGESAKKKEIFYGSSFEAKEQMEKVVRDNEDKESIIKELSRKLQESAQDEAGFKKEIQELKRKVTVASAPQKAVAPVQVDNKVMEQL